MNGFTYIGLLLVGLFGADTVQGSVTKKVIMTFILVAGILLISYGINRKNK